MTKEQTHKLCLAFNEKGYQSFLQLQQDLNLTTETDVMRKALGLLSITVEKQKAGYSLFCIKTDEITEIQVTDEVIRIIE